MGLPKLGSSERKHLGLKGEIDTDYRCRFDKLEIIPAGAFLAENPAQEVDVVVPGDLVVIWSNAQLHLDKTVAAASAHPELLKAGFCSFPSLYTEDHNGPVSILFKCEREISLSALPYMLAIVSLGTCKQGV